MKYKVENVNTKEEEEEEYDGDSCSFGMTTRRQIFSP